jgi:uncharacterized protein (TIGR00369 family)
VNVGEGALARPGLVASEGGPEKFFGVARNAADGDDVVSSMATGPWLAGPAGRPLGGTLGVLIDNVLGFAIARGHLARLWSVSAEISLDLIAPLPADGTRLTARGRLVHAGPHGGIATGAVTDAAGQVIALCRQHGRWVTGPEDPAAGAAATRPRDPAALARGDERGTSPQPSGVRADSLAALLRARVQATEGGAELDLAVTGDLVNPLGNLHGGITFAACDLVAQAALLAAGGPAQAASIRVAYPRPVPLGATPRFQARLLHRGRALGIVAVTVSTEDAKPRAIATVTTGPPG